MAEYIKKTDALRIVDEYHSARTNAYKRIRDIPAEKVAPIVYARWLDGRCTNCCWEEPDEVTYNMYTDDWEETPFCPNCGADMKGF